MRGLISWVVFAVYTNFVFLVSLTPGKDVPSFVGQFDKLLHMGVFAVLYLAALPAFRTIKRFLHSAEFTAFGYALLVGALTELLQRYVPGRQATLLDFAADALGALLALFVIKYR